MIPLPLDPGPTAPGAGALILAAGSGTRSGAENKLLVPDAAGTPLIGWTAALVAEHFPLDRCLLVLGHGAAPVGAAARGAVPGLATAVAPDHREGMAASLRCGIAHAAAAGWPAAMVFLGDMPLLRPDTVVALLDAFAAAGETPDAVFPVGNGRHGHPVLWHRRRFPALRALSGDGGGRALLALPGLRTRAVACDDPGAFADFDTPERLALFRQLPARHRSPG